MRKPADGGSDELHVLLYQMERAAEQHPGSSIAHADPGGSSVALVQSKNTDAHQRDRRDASRRVGNLPIAVVSAISGVLCGSVVAVLWHLMDLESPMSWMQLASRPEQTPKTVTRVRETDAVQPQAPSALPSEGHATPVRQPVQSATASIDPGANASAASPAAPSTQAAGTVAALVERSPAPAGTGAVTEPKPAAAPAPVPTGLPASGTSTGVDASTAKPGAQTQHPPSPAPAPRRAASQAALPVATPRVAGPAEWQAPANSRTRLPYSFEPPAEAHRHHVLVSGLEATAFISRAVEVFAGTWMIRARDLGDAMVERKSVVPERIKLAIELRRDTGGVVSRSEVFLLAPPTSASGTTKATQVPLPSSLALQSNTAEGNRLLQQARQLLGKGDLPNARMLLEHASNLGNAEAALALGETYGKAGTASGPAVSANADQALARSWFERAAALGSSEARRRIAEMPAE